MNRRVQVGLAGCGQIARSHIGAYPEIPEGELVGFYDVDRSLAEATKSRYEATLAGLSDEARRRGEPELAEAYAANAAKLKVYDDYGSLITDMDMIDLCVPPPYHMTMAIEALSQNKSLMGEKPMARTWWETEALGEVAARSKGFYQHNENWMFNPAFQRLRYIVEMGLIGDVQRVTVSLPNGGPTAVPSLSQGWRRDPFVAGGGSLIDWGVHALGAAWYLAGLDKQPSRVRSAGIFKRRPQIAVEDDAWVEVLVEHPNTHCWATLLAGGGWASQSREDPSDTIVRVDGTKGQTWIEGNPGTSNRINVHIYQPPFPDRVLPIESRLRSFGTESWLNEARNFVVCVQRGVPSMVDHRVGAEITAVTGAAYLSEAERRRVVTLDEFKQWSRDMATQAPGEEGVRKMIATLMAPYAPA